MIYGIGTDMARIERFDALLARHGLRCGQRLLAESELAELAQAKQPARFLAKRFAAKEALGKALGTGVRAPVLLTAIAVVHDALGKPMFAFSDPLQDFLHQRGICAVHLSISDEQQHAFAFVVCESALAANP
ncbi:holo-ACP synthase [Vogesella alkaliphila]|uniref:Holo-[acyl-carrier-protein] synthase n=1 Tax=Vogesella alkaliphila TaxID=1193621 RepID=A0ABQ2YX46_9NEIS|nr:holo-ACP synthase [Vogesella alkaliphila]GGX98260.1 holo-[acyl-carrier-protein] synthase [Vogesella alkaliphila]